MRAGRFGVVRFGAFAGLVSPVLFALLVVTMGALHPGYSHLTDFISDLGALDAPTPYVQRLNFLQFGLGIALMGIALFRGMERPSRVALVFQLVIGLGVFLSAFFPGHANDATSRASMMHNLVGVPAFLLIMLVPFVTGRRFRASKEWRRFSRYSIAMTPTLIVLFVLMARADGSPEGSPGLYQRLFIGTWMVWMVVISSHLLRLSDDGRASEVMLADTPSAEPSLRST